MRRVSLIGIAVSALASIVSCNFVMETPLAAADLKRVVQPDYVVVRAKDDPKVLMDLRDFDLDGVEVKRMEPSDIYGVTLATNAPGDEKLEAWTSANVGKQVEIYLDGKLISSPVVQTPISGMIMLSGGFSKSQAEEIAARLRRGGA